MSGYNQIQGFSGSFQQRISKNYLGTRGLSGTQLSSKREKIQLKEKTFPFLAWHHCAIKGKAGEHSPLGRAGVGSALEKLLGENGSEAFYEA